MSINVSMITSLEKFTQARRVEIPTVHLSPKQIRRLTRLLQQCKKGLPVENVILEEFAIPSDEDVYS